MTKATQRVDLGAELLASVREMKADTHAAGLGPGHREPPGVTRMLVKRGRA